MIALLLIVFRAPLVVLVPLATLYCAVQVTLKILALLAEANVIEVFDGLDVYTTVLVYGAGVDYSLFLVSRYREELGRESGPKASAAQAVGHVGLPISASAGTEILGIAMLAFLVFGKFQQAGISIPLGLFITFLAALTLAPGLLRSFGQWTFWPRAPGQERNAEKPNAMTHNLWEKIASQLERRPGLIWLTTVAAMTPFAVLAIWNYQHLSYGLLDDLPQSAVSIQGIEALEKHFPRGKTGRLTLVMQDEEVDFGSERGKQLIQRLTDRLWPKRRDLQLSEIRSAAQPLGTKLPVEEVIPQDIPPALVQDIVEQQVTEYYVGGKRHEGHVTRLELVLSVDPLSPQAIEQIKHLEDAIKQKFPEELQQSEFFLVGPTASLRDLKRTAQQDRRDIQIRVTLVVLAVLCLVLRRIAIPLYSIITVLFSYLTTLGVTWGVFRLLNGPNFPGLDWTVPIFLFTLLVAVGEDYNILLVTRVDEEQDKRGSIEGIKAALLRTGGIISACGIIMAGTFSSVAVGGKLSVMYQLGFALAFGILLDTFIVRPLLVPSYLVLVNSGRLGKLGRLLGGRSG